MAKTFHAQILTPEGKLFEGEVTGIQVPGSEGSFEMLAGHAAIVSTLESGQVRIRTSSSGDIYITISGGFVEMENDRLTLLAETAEVAEKG